MGTGIIVLISIVVFLTIILLLVGVLLYVRAKLTPPGKVKITINDETEIEADPGSSLLSTLSAQKIFLPSACGGGGTCAMCKCQVFEGAGDILPTEKGYFTRKEQQNNWRLGCQVKVRGDLKIGIPKEIFGIKKWECEVVSNRNVATFIKEFVVRLPEGETLDFQSGGYIQIDVPKCEVDFKDIIVEDKFREDWDKLKIWDLKMKNPEPIFRAYSMANHPAEGNIVMLNIRIATPPWDRAKNQFMNVNPGICSSYIFSRKPGDKVMVSGPYGEFHIKHSDKEMLYIGGGAGMAPLRSQIFHMFHTEKTNRKVTYWYGARSLREVFYDDEFKAIEKDFPNFKFNIALSEPLPEDNWNGYTGFIHQVVLDNYLSKHPEPEEIEFYLCGPPMMNSAVFKMLDNLGVPKENIAFDDFGG
ncbi:NADH:ubiquinone reductase (Na(+)-transporting) subunit F [Lentimicrobium sp.]|jgi:Na+-transporting NADH:ubiquinone oxidoreductase subunit F|uniref:NADH:ubiquinone reductase (Na(+)-transporting) subunit F n=1 Tax=Lentimicrobium sp. TaxID=2034841 RepID=UPI002CF814C6|nr:NADH:ubiquinone reductase (Na(+)-transporting) subunit F [Lentimicrobium sp.]HPF64917.1 NADH:ubiquinone reductase (Na(+)-transporting) subunit F [Lentimicrobium sp.]HPJ61537.1 NADH:ubiquinone reductase (Na(+)-transporting) subunit F [Lentimicrobium sp.]HPR26233.1 NADH:ubiquinone reductase (Na(+)-transporting) subunit F [Lentimicrobium sp.]HRW69050.1 NADH:ubiquinone reductase (Na(+)-transporting) subunit F [Lentimicrobium sp.]